ncbi:hypothetical protein FH972_004458 [Carpinus fangiana]|uniref:Disease resistance protein At4g27190-like leucine-rich repeats domain-containing protein n=1 Tax=Carpinus fangiana TaxID=176857 RepID=A0A5N6QL71_9ROSI|nr:hypothetical protein FH972_004458 [Carpinus fangiana]
MRSGLCVYNEESEIEPEAVKMDEHVLDTIILMQGGLVLTKLPKDIEDWKNVKEINLMHNELSSLPENPSCPRLLALILHNKNKFKTIPPSFFDYMPALQILNLSRTDISVMESDALVPRGVISALFCLKELMISVNPDDKRAELVRYFLLNSPMWVHPLLSNFRLTIGHHVNRIMSRLSGDVEFELERWERCLKYINGDQTIPEEIKTILQYPTTFFLERHATAKKLSGSRIEKQLKCCVVGECNEVEVIIDETDAHEGVVLGSLEYLCIYYMKNLRRIWEGPIQPKCSSLLKFLTLRTCPVLTTIFIKGLLDNLCNLEELTIDDYPSIKTLVSCKVSAEHKTSHFLPNLKRMSLYYMLGLFSISSGLHTAPRLESLSFYDCPNLKNMSIEEVSNKDLKKIKAELVSSWPAQNPYDTMVSYTRSQAPCKIQKNKTSVVLTFFSNLAFCLDERSINQINLFGSPIVDKDQPNNYPPLTH